MLQNWPLWAIALVLFLAMLAALEAGHQLQFRIKLNDRQGGRARELVSAAIVLLAVLLGFSFVISFERMDTRRSLVIQEANAIGTTYLRADLLPSDQAAALKTRLAAYTDTRLAFYDAGVDQERLSQAYDQSEKDEQEIWQQVAALARAQPDSEMLALLLTSVNEMIDLAAARRAALENKDPPAVVYTLMAVAIIVAGMLGYMVQERRAHYVMTILFMILVNLIISIVIDIDRPRRGLIRVSQAPLVELQRSMR